MRRYKLRLLGSICALLALCLTLMLALNRHWFIPPAATYELSATYTNLPGDDEAIAHWLKIHPEWRDVSVSRNANTVTLQFGDDHPKPAIFHDLMSECEHLGYSSSLSYRGTLRDRSQRGTNWYTFWVEYAELPVDDTAVSAWLAAQPGTSQTTVSRQGNIVSFEFCLASPPPPTILGDITRACERIGYHGRKGYISAFGRYR